MYQNVNVQIMHHTAELTQSYCRKSQHTHKAGGIHGVGPGALAHPWGGVSPFKVPNQ